jgi:hypothetical protein
MTTYSQVEKALTNLGYAIDFNLRYHAKLMGYIPVEGYESEIILEFREAICSELGDREELLEVEWLMDDGESCLVLDRESLDAEDEEPDVFEQEKIILRKIFDRILEEISNIN